MRRTASFFIVLGLAVPVASPASPAQALGICVGTGTMQLSRGLYYVPDYRFGVSFTMTLSCLDFPRTISGVLSQASCGNSLGSGNSGTSSFSIAVVGDEAVMFGGVNGVAHLIPQG